MKLLNRAKRQSKVVSYPSVITFGAIPINYKDFSEHMKYITNSTLVSVSRVIAGDLNAASMTGEASDYFENNKVFTKHQLINSIVRDLIVHGNALLSIDYRKRLFNYIPYDNLSSIDFVETIGDLQYTFFDNLLNQTMVANNNEILHFKFLTDSQGFYGIAPTEILNNTLALEYKAWNLAVENLDNSMFSQGILKVDGQLSNDAKENMKANFEKSSKSGQIVIVDDTMDYRKDDSSFKGFDVLSKSRDNVATIAALFGINPERLGAEQTNSSSNALNHQEDNYIKVYTSIIEDEINAKFKSDNALQFVLPVQGEVQPNENNQGASGSV